MSERSNADTVNPIQWNAAEYHRLSDPHVDWGTRVLARVPLRGDEVVLDAGCGTGRLTAQLLERLPNGRVLALDRSSNMLEVAASNLTPKYGDRVVFIEQDLDTLALSEQVDVILSTATFHWVLDHDGLFARLFAALRPGGHVVAQCGGGPNLVRLKQRFDAVVLETPGTEAIRGWVGPWEFASDETSKTRMENAGFIEVGTSLEEAPTQLADAETYREFLRTVILRAHLERIGNAAVADALLDQLTALAAADEVPFFLDYWRLNLAGTRPA
ncbi:MAG: class I SAM-dependent methyltransferase [Chloroflexota bacterium]